MKNVLALTYATGILFLELMYGSGCVVEVEREPLDPAQALQYDVLSPELQADVDTAMEHLVKASGLPFELAAQTTPILAVDSSEIDGDCAQTHITYETKTDHTIDVVMWVANPPPVGCYQDVWRTIEHELIHSVRRDEDHGTVVHSATGVFQAVANGKDQLLNADSLSLLCEFAGCSKFEAEQ